MARADGAAKAGWTFDVRLITRLADPPLVAGATRRRAAFAVAAARRVARAWRRVRAPKPSPARITIARARIAHPVAGAIIWTLGGLSAVTTSVPWVAYALSERARAVPTAVGWTWCLKGTSSTHVAREAQTLCIVAVTVAGTVGSAFVRDRTIVSAPV